MEQLDALFVNHHSEVLIQRVTPVMPIAVALRDNKIFQRETHSQILEASTDVDKMTVLLLALSNDKAKSAFYSVLKTKNPNLVEELEQQDAQFLNYHSPDLIQRVTAVMPIADALISAKIINRETYLKISIKNSTRMDKTRELLCALSTKKAKSAVYNLLKDKEPFLVEDLEKKEVRQGIKGAQTSSEVLEIESHPQNAETSQVQTTEQKNEEKQIRWKKSSKRHSTKVEELLKETDIEKVGNLYFYKDEKYMISSGGSGTQVYFGLSEDGFEVAIKLITKNPKNNKDFENELNHLQDLKLESKYIVRYVTFAVSKDFYYLANQLCEYDLEDYMKYLRQREPNDKESILRKIVKEMLLGLQVLHHAEVIHRDIKPRNVLIDTEERARLADFGISRKLEEGKTTVYTDRAGTQGWEATEIVNQTLKGRYKKSSDIQVAGMLTYYILSDGKHPFGDAVFREGNILKGEYSLDDVRDKKAMDLVEWMINKDQDKRPTVDKVLDHPYFWDDKRIREVLHNLGNKEEVQEYKNYESNKELYNTVQKYTNGRSFSNWKLSVPETWTKIGKSLPNDLLGLLRYLRNAMGHQEKLFYEEKMIDEFPDFLISLHWLATDMGWEY